MKLRKYVQRAQRFLPPANRGVVVLAYHLVDGGSDSPVDLPRQRFVEQLDHLVNNCEVLGLNDAISRVNDSTDRPRVVLTFDDAYENFASVVWPLLHERGLPSFLYVPIGFVSGSSGPPVRGATLPACSWSCLRDLRRAGVEMGSHGVRHVDMRKLDDEQLDEELTRSRKVLQAELNAEIDSFCYVQGKHSPRVVSATRRVYRTATAGGGRRFQGRDLHLIPRFPIRRDDVAFEGLLTSGIWLTEAMADVVRRLRS